MKAAEMLDLRGQRRKENGGKARVIQQGRRLASVDSAVFASSNQCSADEPSAPVWSLPASLDCRCRKSASKFRIMVGGVVLDEDGRDWTTLSLFFSLSLGSLRTLASKRPIRWEEVKKFQLG